MEEGLLRLQRIFLDAAIAEDGQDLPKEHQPGQQPREAAGAKQSVDDNTTPPAI